MASAAGAKVRGMSPQQYHQAEHRGMSPSANVCQRILVWSCTVLGASGSRYIAVSLHTDAAFYGRLSFSVANTGYMQVGFLIIWNTTSLFVRRLHLQVCVHFKVCRI